MMASSRHLHAVALLVAVLHLEPRCLAFRTSMHSILHVAGDDMNVSSEEAGKDLCSDLNMNAMTRHWSAHKKRRCRCIDKSYVLGPSEAACGKDNVGEYKFNPTLVGDVIKDECTCMSKDHFQVLQMNLSVETSPHPEASRDQSQEPVAPVHEPTSREAPEQTQVENQGGHVEERREEETDYTDTSIYGEVKIETIPASPDVKDPCEAIVPGALKRHWAQRKNKKCRCDKDSGHLLSTNCGPGFAGEYKFDVNALPSPLPEGCGCIPSSAYQHELARRGAAQPEVEEAAFDKINAIADNLRSSLESQEEQDLAAEFKAEFKESMSSVGGGSGIVSEPEQRMPECKHPIPGGFRFGQYVKINKQVLTGQWLYVFPVYRRAGYQGLAQIVCPPRVTRGIEGRICLRRGDGGQKSAGCWLPENLELVEDPSPVIEDLD